MTRNNSSNNNEIMIITLFYGPPLESERLVALKPLLALTYTRIPVTHAPPTGEHAWLDCPSAPGSCLFLHLFQRVHSRSTAAPRPVLSRRSVISLSHQPNY